MLRGADRIGPKEINEKAGAVHWTRWLQLEHEHSTAYFHIKRIDAANVLRKRLEIVTGLLRSMGKEEKTLNN